MEFIDVITNLGFPIAVAAYALWNSYKHEQYLQDTLKTTLEDNTKAILELKNILSRITAVSVNDDEENN